MDIFILCTAILNDLQGALLIDIHPTLHVEFVIIKHFVAILLNYLIRFSSYNLSIPPV